MPLPSLKNVEDKAKQLLFHMIALPLRAKQKSPAGISRNSKLLFLRHDKIGDMLISIGIFNMLKQKYPGIQIGVLASPKNSLIAANAPGTDALYIYDKKPLNLLRLIFRIRRSRYDYVINMVLYSSLTGGILTALSAGSWAYRVRMTQHDNKDVFYHRNIRKVIWGNATRSMLEETADILSALGVAYAKMEIRPILRLPENTLKRAKTWSASLGPGIRLGVNIAAGVPEREAPASLWKPFLELFTKRHPDIQLVLFTPPRGKVLTELARLGIPPAVMENPPHDGILGAGALLQEMDAVVSTDTSIPHLCAALGIPVVVLYHCTENAILWEPYGVPCEKLISPAGGHSAQDPIHIMDSVEKLLLRLPQHN